VIRADIADAAGRGAELVAQIAPELGLILGGYFGAPLGVFQKRFAGFRIEKVLFMREGGRDSPGYVAENFRFTPDRLAGKAAAHVAVNRMGNIRTGPIGNKSLPGHEDLRAAQVGRRVSRRITQFRHQNDFRQLFPNMGFLLDVVALRGQRRHAENDVADGRFASRVGMAVEQREEQRVDAAVLPFAGQKDALPGNKAVLKNHVRIR